MKKRYNVILDEEEKETVTQYLASMGMSFSGWFNTVVCEFASVIKGQPVSVGVEKKLEDLTLKEFTELASYWIKKASEE